MSFYDNDHVAGVPITRETDGQCIVCGSKGTNCSTTDDGPKHIVTLGKEEELLKIDEITFDEDIFEEREIAPGVWAKTLVARAGRPMKKKKAMDLGII